MVQAPNAYDAKTLWNHIVWPDTLKASSFGYDGSDNVDYHDFIQVLCLVRTSHFDDACVCFTKDADNYSFINCLNKLPTIFHETTYDLTKMDEREFTDHVTQLHNSQKEKRARMEEELISTIAVREQVVKVQAEAFAKAMDNNIVNEVIIDLASTGVMDETLEVSKVAQANEIVHQEKELLSK